MRESRVPKRVFPALLLSMAMSLASTSASAEPEYASTETREVIERMVEAHGGLERWQAAPSIRFDNVMFMNMAGPQQLPWWASHEVIEQGGRRAYQEWPLDQAMLAYDGERVWSQNWKRGNMPVFMTHFFYYFVNLPWLTQDDGVILGEPGRYTWPGTDRELISIEMRYAEAPTVGKTARDYYVLFIDPETYRLRAYQYAIGYGPMLDLMGVPADRPLFGPMWRLITRDVEVDGLVFPASFRTMPEPDGKMIAGSHLILNYAIDQPFDASRVEPPANAVFDDSIDERRR